MAAEKSFMLGKPRYQQICPYPDSGLPLMLICRWHHALPRISRFQLETQIPLENVAETRPCRIEVSLLQYTFGAHSLYMHDYRLLRFEASLSKPTVSADFLVWTRATGILGMSCTTCLPQASRSMCAPVCKLTAFYLILTSNTIVRCSLVIPCLNNK